MSTPAERIMEYVERELKENPEVTNATLLKGARKISRTVSRLSARQFHAKYPLQVKRRGASGTKRVAKAKPTRRVRRVRVTRAPRTTPAVAKQTGNRDAVRNVLMRFAKDLTAADSQTETIEVLANLDQYAAEIMTAARS